MGKVSAGRLDRIPISEGEAIKLAQTTDNPEVLEMLYNQHKEKPKVVRSIVNNPYCLPSIKKDYLRYVFGNYLRAYRDRLRLHITDWDDLLDAIEICLNLK